MEAILTRPQSESSGGVPGGEGAWGGDSQGLLLFIILYVS